MTEAVPFLTLAVCAIAFVLVMVALHFRTGSIFRPLPARCDDLDDFRWKKRPILVFAGPLGDGKYARQMDILMRAGAKLRARDVVVLADDDPARQARLRKRLGSDGFTIVLFDKDGGINLRASVPVDLDRISAAIDRIPPRGIEAGA